MIALLICASQSSAQISWHARISPTYIHESTNRGGWSIGVLNFFGASLQSGRIGFDAMASAEPYSLADCGYAHLLVSDPHCGSYPRDIQAAHPLLMQARARITTGAFGLSAGLADAPALGPLSYMHRASAAVDPIAPYTDHLTNPYHAAYSVITFNATTSRLTFAASAFDSHERHSEPKAIDPHKPDSYSALFSVAANRDVRFSISAADVPASAHAGHGGGEATGRTRVAFVTAETKAGAVTWLGVAGFHDIGPGVRVGLLEGTLSRPRFAVFARGEIADAIEEIVSIVELPNGVHQHNVVMLRSAGAQVAAGAVARRSLNQKLSADFGARGWLSFIPRRRNELYERRSTAPGFALFVTLNARSASEHHH
ncbi:MAG TPA: hypothetical protein VM100_10335 [Longimicrobiales bacterium]|nr:hypothetical protein [Longimicrobiales bacterium]